jgi:hypothetical protein
MPSLHLRQPLVGDSASSNGDRQWKKGGAAGAKAPAAFEFKAAPAEAAPAPAPVDEEPAADRDQLLKQIHQHTLLLDQLSGASNKKSRTRLYKKLGKLNQALIEMGPAPAAAGAGGKASAGGGGGGGTDRKRKNAREDDDAMVTGHPGCLEGGAGKAVDTDGFETVVRKKKRRTGQAGMQD